MHKRRLHHLYIRLKEVRYLYLAVLFVIAAATFVFAYRYNNLEALRLRDVLVQVDRDNGDVETALTNLREYTYAHMNANLSNPSGVYPPIQLKYTYERLVAAEKAKAESVNANLYTDAQNYCEQQITSRLTTQRVPCINEYLANYSTPTITEIPDALYKFDFVAPAWSPDLAGWSLVAAAFLALVILIRIVLEFWMRSQLRE